MSYSVEFLLRCELKYDIPESVKDVLSFLFDDSDGRKYDEVKFDIDHDFFRDDCFYKIGRHRYSINCSYLNLRELSLATINDFKNDTYLIHLFLDWLLPYIDEYEDGKVIGWIFQEETLVPELIYYRCDNDGENASLEFIYAKDISRLQNETT